MSCASGPSTNLRAVKAVILAGGFGSRLSEETAVRPKPMVEIGGKPILWHIMKIYAAHGIEEFVICLGYKGYLIKEYFANYYLHTCDVTFDLASGDMEVHRSETEPWRVTLVDTGEADDDRRAPQAGAALPRRRGLLLHLRRRPRRRRHHGARSPSTASRARCATVTAVQPPGRFGALDVDGERVREFEEKPRGDGGWTNGGFFVLSPGGRRYLEGDDDRLGAGADARARARGPARLPTATRASGRRWTRCATATTSRSCGASGEAPWRTW